MIKYYYNKFKQMTITEKLGISLVADIILMMIVWAFGMVGVYLNSNLMMQICLDILISQLLGFFAIVGIIGIYSLCKHVITINKVERQKFGDSK